MQQKKYNNKKLREDSNKKNSIYYKSNAIRNDMFTNVKIKI